MITIHFPGEYVLSAPGKPYDGVQVSGAQSWQVPTASCNDIMFALEDYHLAQGWFPVDCTFETLAYSGVVLFQDSSDLSYKGSIEVYLLETPTFTKADLDMIFSVETGFIIAIIGIWTLARNLRKISPLLFG